MSDSEATVEDTTLYQTKDTPLALSPQGSDEVVDRAGQDVQPPPDGKHDSRSDEANAEGDARQYPSPVDVAKKPYDALRELDDAVDDLGAAVETAAKSAVDRLASKLKEMEATVERLQAEIQDLKKGTTETSDYGDERVEKASTRKRTRKV
ncbi:hypothetical protein H2199_003963 [Coniosporium tulheliwenetii]|uniref:Uncharacterized protein n=1 Tax=Coniosporium tulheliwenetii TaxID=3383036 RepID=A0ACC2Z9R7_9PEZI|nr:hypothetical protein H2199_003963 [Cladosporium sp. JES 115]